MSPFSYDPSFGQFFGSEDPGRGHPREQREQSLGSGVIVSQDGYLLTNNHVVEDATEIRISLANKREMRAKVIGTNPHTDVAVLKVDEKNLPAPPLGDSASVKPGEFVLAVGSPFGLGRRAHHRDARAESQGLPAPPGSEGAAGCHSPGA